MGSAEMRGWLAATAVAWVCVGLVPVSVGAAEAEPTVVGQQAPAPVALPPPDSPTLLAFPSLELSFPSQGGVSSVAGETYLYYMQIDEMISLPSQERWTPFDETIERVLLEDFRSLWGTGFLNDLTIEIIDAPYPNGVPAKRVVFLMEERERERITTIEGSDEYEQTEINDALEQAGIELSFPTKGGVSNLAGETYLKYMQIY